jgi:hypothetical protein
LLSLLAEFNLDQFKGVFARWPPSGEPVLSSRLASWDVAHYLQLSESGYEPGSHSCAFYPLWPAMIQAVTPLTFGEPMAAALLLCNLLSVAALWLFYDYARNIVGESTSRDALILLLVFPGALFFSVPYTESAYFLLVMGFFRALTHGSIFWIAVLTFLLPFTRAVGVFIVFPLVWHLFEQRRAFRYWLLLASPVIGYAGYFGLMYAWTGNLFEGFEAQKSYPYSPSISNMFHLARFTEVFLNVRTLDGMMDGLLDRALFVLVLLLLPLIYRLDKTWFWYVLPAGVVPAMTSYFMSYRRYIMVLFPVFIVLAQLLARSPKRWLFWYYAIALAVLQAWAIKQFVSFNWAG